MSSSPFSAPNTPSRTNTLRKMYGSRKVDTNLKPEPQPKKSHWTDNPGLVKSMNDAVMGLLNEHNLQNGLDEWTVDGFMEAHGIDKSGEYSVVRRLCHEAVKIDFRKDIMGMFTADGHIDETAQLKAFGGQYDTLDEAFKNMAPKALRNSVGLFVAGAFKEASLASVKKGKTTVTTDEKNRAIDKAFDPETPEAEAKEIFAQMGSGTTISPDLPTSPTAPPEKPAEQPKPDAIGALNMKLWNMIADEFKDSSLSDNDNKAQLKTHYKRALQADNFNDFVMKHSPIEKAEEVGLQMVKAYIQASMPQQPAEPPDAPKADAKPANKPSSSVPPVRVLNEAEVRAKYTKNLGGDYLTVAGRILLFRMKHEKGQIVTDLLSIDDSAVMFKATIFGADGTLLSTGFARTEFANSKNFKGRALEKAETSAIGRALAHAGFGTDAAGEDVDEDDQLSDAPVKAA